jgi:transcriptional regulator GlxA family with amidase domain
MNQARNVAILIFNQIEVLDFAGPFEVFSVTGRRDGSDPFNVYTVAETTEPVLARNHLSVNPRYTFKDCPTPDILVVPGGGGYTTEGDPFGTRHEMHNVVLLDWVQHCAAHTELLLSVCTGALILAKAGLLEGRSATTHQGAIAELKEVAPQTEVLPDQRLVDNGNLILSGGISAGIDMSLYVVAKLLGQSQAIETAKYMEYDWREQASTLSV